MKKQVEITICDCCGDIIDDGYTKSVSKSIPKAIVNVFYKKNRNPSNPENLNLNLSDLCSFCTESLSDHITRFISTINVKIENLKSSNI